MDVPNNSYCLLNDSRFGTINIMRELSLDTGCQIAPSADKNCGNRAKTVGAVKYEISGFLCNTLYLSRI